jgi:hypothetical protein
MTDVNPSREIALNRMVEASAALEVQLDKDASRRPVLFLLKKAREAALHAYDMLIYSTDAMDVNIVRQLQFEIRRYDDLVAWCREIIIAGKEANQLISESERMEFSAAILSPDNEDEVRGVVVNYPEDY